MMAWEDHISQTTLEGFSCGGTKKRHCMTIPLQNLIWSQFHKRKKDNIKAASRAL